MTDAAHPLLPVGVATGVGSLPGDDPREAVALVLGEAPDFPYLPELPARGPGAAMIGRTAALLADLTVDLQPSGWRVVPRRGLDIRRAVDFLARDLDALEEAASGHDGPLKVQAAGPWTLVAAIELHRGDKLLADPGAVRDVVGSLAEGLGAHVADLRRRLPRAQLVVQLDEPSLTPVLTAGVPTASGYGTLRGVTEQVVSEALAAILLAVREPGAAVIVHSCAADVPLPMLTALRPDGISVDGAALGPKRDDDIAEAVEAGIVMLLGVVPGTDTPLPAPQVTSRAVRERWSRIGFDPDRAATGVVLTPSCGLAGASPPYARAVSAHLHTAAGRLRE